jgi:hypothetical protein
MTYMATVAVADAERYGLQGLIIIYYDLYGNAARLSKRASDGNTDRTSLCWSVFSRARLPLLDLTFCVVAAALYVAHCKPILQ